MEERKIIFHLSVIRRKEINSESRVKARGRKGWRRKEQRTNQICRFDAPRGEPGPGPRAGPRTGMLSAPSVRSQLQWKVFSNLFNHVTDGRTDSCKDMRLRL